MKKQINEVKRMQLIAGLITESEYRKSQMDEAEIINFDDLKKHQATIRKEQDYLLDITKKLGVDNKLVGDFNKSLNDLMAAVFEKNKLNEMDEAEMDEAKKKKSISSSGLITFDQLKQAVFQEYGFEDDEDVIESFKEVNDLGDLVMLLDDLGYNDEEAYEFIIKAILK